MDRNPDDQPESDSVSRRDLGYGLSMSGSELWLRLAACVASAASMAALLAKLFGLVSMRSAGLGVALPCSLLLIGIWVWAQRCGKKNLATDLAIGFVAGALATIAYDLFRMPFQLTGQRIFTPISAFGMWLANAQRSSRITELVGWTYHYSNGITLGVMYALFMRGRHWAWAVVWACGLETAAIISPFGTVFRLRGNFPGITIAYLGHVAYGVPLGWLVWKWRATRDWLATVPAPLWQLGALVVCAGADRSICLARRAAGERQSGRARISSRRDLAEPRLAPHRSRRDDSGFQSWASCGPGAAKARRRGVNIPAGQREHELSDGRHFAGICRDRVADPQQFRDRGTRGGAGVNLRDVTQQCR